MKKILVTGASGLLAWNFCRWANEHFSILGCSRGNITNSHFPWTSCDLSIKKQFCEIVDSFQPDAIIHTAALSKPSLCEESPDLSYKHNVDASLIVLEQAIKKNIPLLFTSTDWVFSGKKDDLYTESDTPDPTSVYGKHKAMIEKAYLEESKKTSIIRLSYLLGPASPYKPHVSTELKTAKKEKRTQLFYDDEFRCPLFINDLYPIFNWSINESYSGIIHAASKAMSRYELAINIAKAYGLPTEIIRKGSQSDDKDKQTSYRPKKLLLDNTKAKNLGFKFQNISSLKSVDTFS